MGTRVFLPRTVWAAQRQSGQGAVRRKVQALYRCVEMDFPAERQNFPAQIAHDLRQVIRTDVRLCFPQDRIRRTGAHKCLEHVADTRVFCAGIEFAVRKGAGAAFAELNVGIRCQDAGFPERLDVFLPLLDGRAALKDDRPHARLC